MLRWSNRAVEVGCGGRWLLPTFRVLIRGRDGLATGAEGGAAMKYYAGLDVSMKETAVCVIDGDGAVVAASLVPQVVPPVDPSCLAR